MGVTKLLERQVWMLLKYVLLHQTCCHHLPLACFDSLSLYLPSLQPAAAEWGCVSLNFAGISWPVMTQRLLLT